MPHCARRKKLSCTMPAAPTPPWQCNNRQAVRSRARIESNVQQCTTGETYQISRSSSRNSAFCCDIVAASRLSIMKLPDRNMIKPRVRQGTGLCLHPCVHCLMPSVAKKGGFPCWHQSLQCVAHFPNWLCTVVSLDMVGAANLLQEPALRSESRMQVYCAVLAYLWSRALADVAEAISRKH